MVKLWKHEFDREAGEARIVEVDCPDGRYPARDADGCVVYVNTHFDTPDEALRHLVIDADAAVFMAGVEVRGAREGLRRAEGNAAAAVLYRAAVKRVEDRLR